MGIVNGTTNYILTQMAASGASYQEALSEAQSLAYAEREGTVNVEGLDAAAKAAILANVAFGAKDGAGDVYREGISALNLQDLGGQAAGLRHQAAGSGEAGPDGSLGVRVHPAMVPKDHPLAAVRDSFNAVFVEGDAVGELMLFGRGAGGLPTASAVIGDLVDAAHNLTVKESPASWSSTRWPSARSTTFAAPITSACSWLTVPVCSQPSRASSAATTCPSGPWSRTRPSRRLPSRRGLEALTSATPARPTWCSSPTRLTNATCKLACTSYAVSRPSGVSAGWSGSSAVEPRPYLAGSYRGTPRLPSRQRVHPCRKPARGRHAIDLGTQAVGPCRSSYLAETRRRQPHWVLQGPGDDSGHLQGS